MARLDFELLGPDTRSDLGAVDAAVRFELVYGVSTKLASGVQADSWPDSWARKRSTNVRITTAMLNPLAPQKPRNRS